MLIDDVRMLIGIAAALVLILGPSIVGLSGLLGRHRPQPHHRSVVPRWNWRLTASSALLYALAYNLTFFIQELFLVLPKAFLPGVHATLFHNNHIWQGHNPLTSLFQGTGALATFISGALCARRLRRRPPASTAWRLFLIWMTYNGLLQALSQVVVGALLPANDVGMAMDYLGLGPLGKSLAALLALVAIPAVALALTRRLLALADAPARLESARGRSAFIFGIATLPALLAIVLIIPFRIPRELLEVLAPPLAVTVIGTAWMQASAWRLRGTSPNGVAPIGSPLYPLAALLALLLMFQLVLRPGIRL
jgi:hypothetical protein